MTRVMPTGAGRGLGWEAMAASTHRHTWTGERVLMWAVVAGFVMTALGCVLAWATSPGWDRAWTVSVLLAAVLAWAVLRRRPASRVALVVLTVATVLLLFSPTSAALATLQMYVVVALVGFRSGMWAGTATAVSVGVAMPVAMLWAFDVPVRENIRYSPFVILLLMVGALLGVLARRAEESRARAERLNAELQAAKVKLQGTVVTERELVLAQERARAARELHDGLGHQLTVSKMSMEFALRMHDQDPGKAMAEVRRAMATTQEALQDIRLWARALNPPAPAPGASGAAAFETIAEAFRGTGLDVRLVHRGEEDTLPGEVQVFVTRVIQEGLTNVLKHAGAKQVDIEIVQSPAQLRLTMADDGTGGAAGLGPGRGQGADLGLGPRWRAGSSPSSQYAPGPTNIRAWAKVDRRRISSGAGR